jgi:hypothetical protein
MDGFDHCNEIVDLTISTKARGQFVDGTDLPPYRVVQFERGLGMSASFRCFRVEVVDAKRCASSRDA